MEEAAYPRGRTGPAPPGVGRWAMPTCTATAPLWAQAASTLLGHQRQRHQQPGLWARRAGHRARRARAGFDGQRRLHRLARGAPHPPRLHRGKPPQNPRHAAGAARRAPSRANEKIEVESRYQPQPTDLAWNRNPGTVAWQQPLAAGATAQFSAEHTIRYPKAWTCRNANDLRFPDFCSSSLAWPPPRRASAAFMLAHPAHAIALGFGSGLSPFAPWHRGHAVGWMSFRCSCPGSVLQQMGLLIAGGALVGWWACTTTARNLRVADPAPSCGTKSWPSGSCCGWPCPWASWARSRPLPRSAFDAAKPGPVGG